MAKRRTLKRQRDNALKELELLKKRMDYLRINNANRTNAYRQRSHILKASYDVSELEVSQGIEDATNIVRKMLHGLVDGGHFDNYVAKSSEYNVTNHIIRNKIEIEVIQPEANYEAERFAQMWGGWKNDNN